MSTLGKQVDALVAGMVIPSTGLPASGYAVYFTAPGSSDRASNTVTVYQDATMATAWGASVTLNTKGQALVFVPNVAYKMWLYDTTDVLIDTFDNLDGARTSNVDSNEEILINGNLESWLNGTGSFTTAASMCADMWYLQHDALTTVTAAQTTSISLTNSRYGLRGTTSTGNNKKFGFCQFFSNAMLANMAGKKVSLSFYAKVNNTRMSSVRAAWIQWGGTVDDMTLKFIADGSWGAAGTLPTWETNWTLIQAMDASATATAWTNYTLEDVTIPTTANNIALFIWMDDVTYTTGDWFEIAQVWVNYGSTCTSVNFDKPSILQQRVSQYVRTGTVLFSGAVTQSGASDWYYAHCNWQTPMARALVAGDVTLTDLGTHTAVGFATTSGTVVNPTANGFSERRDASGTSVLGTFASTFKAVVNLT